MYERRPVKKWWKKKSNSTLTKQKLVQHCYYFYKFVFRRQYFYKYYLNKMRRQVVLYIFKQEMNYCPLLAVKYIDNGILFVLYILQN